MSVLPTRIGRYEIKSRIGQGGMGVLYLARDPAIDRPLAIKLLREGFNDPELRERFAREARSAGRLRHRNIVTIFDVGEHEGQPFIAMEYIPGETLAEKIRARLPISLERKLTYMEELCAGLGYAHKAGIVHRDIKPANIMIDPEEDAVKILDFGIARGGGAGMTQAGALVGTLNYMSPEQFAGSLVDARSDIFALGAVFYELLTYSQAFPGSLQDGLLKRILEDPPTSLDERHPGLPPAIVHIVGRAIEKRPESRYPDLFQMRAEILAVRQGLDQDSARQDTTAVVARPRAEVATPRGQTPLGATDREALARRRVQQQARFIELAAEAMRRGDFEAARDASEQALLLVPDDERAIQLHVEILRGITEHEAAAWVAEGRRCLERGDFTAADELADRALALDPTPPTALALKRAIEAARLEASERRRRSEVIDERLASARSAADAGRLEFALRQAQEALSLDGTAAAAGGMVRELEERLEQRRRAEDLERRALEAVAAAQQLALQGDIDAALTQLEAFSGKHEAVGASLARLRDQQRIAKESRARERDARERRALTRLSQARAAIREGRLDEGEELARQALALDTPVPGLAEVQAELAAERARIAEDERRRGELGRHLAEAARALADADVIHAEQALSLAHEVDSTDEGTIALASELQRARARQAAREPDRRRHEAPRTRSASRGIAALAAVGVVLLGLGIWRLAPHFIPGRRASAEQQPLSPVVTPAASDVDPAEPPPTAAAQSPARVPATRVPEPSPVGSRESASRAVANLEGATPGAPWRDTSTLTPSPLMRNAAEEGRSTTPDASQVDTPESATAARLEPIMQALASDAEEARRAAVEARAHQTVAFGQADEAMRSARALHADGQFEQSASAFRSAVSLFRQAERQAVAVPVVDERQAIRDVLNAYRTAYESLDVSAVLTVYPALPNSEGLRHAFEEATEVTVGFSRYEPELTAPDRAVVKLNRTQTFRGKRAPGRPETRAVVISLQKTDGRWLITDIR